MRLSEFAVDDDTDYITGLLQNVGKVVMAKVFPTEFAQLTQTAYENEAEVLAGERALLGWDHAAIGAYYLENHKIPAEIVEAVRFHHDPLSAPARKHLAAAAKAAGSAAAAVVSASALTSSTALHRMPTIGQPARMASSTGMPKPS